MSLAERLNEAKKPLRPRFEVWIDGLPKVDREALMASATDPNISTQAIIEAVRAEGCLTSKQTVTAWRKSHGYAR